MRKRDVVRELGIGAIVDGCLEIGAEGSQFLGIARSHHQSVAIGLIQPCEGPRQIPDVGSDAEIAKAASVDDDMEHVGLPAQCAPFCRASKRGLSDGRCGELPRVQRETLRERTYFAAHTGEHFLV